MPGTAYIPRHKGKVSEYCYDSLRNMGIARIQEMAARLWTDYNEHDPGVTILEQVCYALTDLIYRTEFPVPDFLADEQGAIHWEEQCLLPPEVAYPARPTTELDYRQVILDAVQELEDVRLEVVSNQDGMPSGLYRILLRPRVEPASSSNETATTAPKVKQCNHEQQLQLVKAARRAFYAARNLCEDIDSIVIESAVDFKLYASVEISEGFDPATILAQIYYACGMWLAAGIESISYEHALAQGVDPEVLFRGPLVHSGMIVSNRSASRKDFPSSDIYALIKAIPGVESVCTFPSTTSATAASDSVLRLYWPQSDEEIGVKLFHNHRDIKVSLHDLTMRYEELDFATRSMRSDNCNSIVPRPQGKSRHLQEYLSIQHQFPLIYGVGPRGLPASATARQKARSHQLQGYLLFFDQFMADQMATLGNIRQLYSSEIDKYKTYFSQLLDQDSFPEFEEVCDRDGLSHLQKAIASRQYVSRSTRLLDYLLALYGEAFYDDPLIQCAQNHMAKDTDAIIEARIAYLKSIASITRDRAAAVDYIQPPGDRSNRSGLETKLNHILGFEQIYLSTGEGLHVIEYILLRPAQWTKSSDSTLRFRVCLLFPDWLLRCKEPAFRKYAAAAVDSCCPAHIHADIFWLTRKCMDIFDSLYHAWRLSAREQAKADSLLAFLTRLNNKEQGEGC
ncbi:hypothetical protein ACOBR2_00855 [Telmatobacter bradus]|uniref:hypothetical protein n=1 Tax=Telmatobacter bradus TaxID=474953 RepID=UPI003B42D5FF